jgi:hypothetical protein
LLSDILAIAKAIGIPVTMPGGVEIQIPEPLCDPEDMAQCLPEISVANRESILDKLGIVIDSVKLIRQKNA